MLEKIFLYGFLYMFPFIKKSSVTHTNCYNCYTPHFFGTVYHDSPSGHNLFSVIFFNDEIKIVAFLPLFEMDTHPLLLICIFHWFICKRNFTKKISSDKTPQREKVLQSLQLLHFHKKCGLYITFLN